MNVLFIITDQHNAHALGCYGNQDLKTPNIDRLASEGVLFENAICQSGQCRPARYSIWSGQYIRSHGLFANGIVEDPEVPTMPKLFQAGGYKTATVGKHHMRLAPTKYHGFDYDYPMTDYRFRDHGDFLPVKPGRKPVGETDVPNDEHPAGLATALARGALKKIRRKPFFLWCAFHGPHPPICPSNPWAGQYDPDAVSLPPNNAYAIDRGMPGMQKLMRSLGPVDADMHRRILAYYYGYISQIDYNIGLLLDDLDAYGLTEETAIVFTADHGEMMSEHGVWTKSRKGYDATIRVPLIIRLPGKQSAGTRRKEIVGAIDLLPTLLDLCGLKPDAKFQGRSLRPLLEGSSADWRQHIISEIGPTMDRVCLTVRSQTRKLVQIREDNKAVYEQLFDLEADPWEMVNEIQNGAYREDLAGLRSDLAAWEAETPIAKSLQ